MHLIYSYFKPNNGYVALASVLVIAFVVLSIGLSTSLTSINEIQSSLANIKNEESVDFVEGCVEDALLRLNEDEAIPTQIPLPEGTCDIVITPTPASEEWVFVVSGTLDTHTKRIQVTAERDADVTISSWEEIE